MASAELHAELCRSLCQKIYTDPVTLKCGHSFCRGCMEIVLKDQDEVGFYTCPTCGKRFSSRPSLQVNGELSGRVERERSARENPTVLCMTCSLPALKTCLQCIGSVCSKHLAEHETHRLIDPHSLEKRKCRAHGRFLDYYCTGDGMCICADCLAFGDHKGHGVESLEEASKKKKEKMQKVLENLISKREDTKGKIGELSRQEGKEKERAALQERVSPKIKCLNQQIQKHTLCQKDQAVQAIQSKQINELKEEDQQLSMRIQSIEEFCNMDDRDPLDILQRWDSDICQTGLNGNSVQDDISEDESCNGHTDQTNVKDAVHKHQDSTVVKMDPVITEGTYRLDAKSACLLQCSKSKLQLLVNSPLVIDFTMVRNWDHLLSDTYKNKYEIMSRLFKLNTSAPHEISAVYLPHLLSPKEFEINKPYLKCAYFEDGKFNLVSPSKVESSHVVLEGATYTSVGVLIENSQTRKRKQAQSRGTVLIYCKQVTNGFSIHVYLVPMSKREVKKVIETKETRLGFRWIDKNSYIKFVNKDITYTIRGSEGVKLENEELHCLYSATEQYPYATVQVPEKCTTVKLHISEKGEKEDIWSCVLNEEDLYEITGTPSTSNSPSSSEDLHGITGTPSTSNSPSSSENARTFLQKNYKNLCNRLGLLEPILLSLNEKGIITEHEEQLIRSKDVKIEKNRVLLDMVKSKGAEEEFYGILMENDQHLVRSLEKPT
ncbi:NACHT, LRR and PYD domains-containing protein 1b allele 5-like [Rana temporaria]|uniref:NACHT, LRR and PYD domains-containing protein 1b allele 5-like n=1 Tax=Rana temporaria TaxID=8407 RepID=UPI001AAD03C8|nr:NACHT, LRR and PYD domains-containing protein 1b allele 5-like [Rana temporaria]